MLRLMMVIFVTTHVAAADSTGGYGSFRLSSGEKQVVLLELYTSEGCSSCPPADRWLSTLKSDAGLWHEYVPIALHVDYWNYIGWNDRFARKDFSDRQRNYVHSGAARAAYTPGFFRKGEEWLAWSRGTPPRGSRTIVGEMTLHIDEGTVAVRFAPKTEANNALVLTVAVLGMQVATSVRAGENKGKRLKHDFVALDVQSIAMSATASGFKASALLSETSVETDQLAIVAWISASGSQTPIQAVGGYLPVSN